MIQPNEKLLPGNVVMCRNKPYVLTDYEIYAIQNSASYRKIYSPIPLTPEILVQWCGCTCLNEYFMLKDGISIWSVWDSIEIERRNDDGLFKLFYKDACIEFNQNLHTLQNTVYFLSGEEMPVNIPNH